MTRRTRIAAFLALALTAGTLGITYLPTTPAAAASPTRILNSGSQNGSSAQWVETQSLPDGSGAYTATFLVEHAAGRRITHVRVDDDWNGSDNSSSGDLHSVNAEDYLSGSTNLLETSRVTFTFTANPPNSNGRNDRTIRFRVRDDTGQQSASVSAVLHTVDENNDGFCCGLPDGDADYPRMRSASQNRTEVTPGQSITYTFRCDDVDTDFFSDDDDCDRANIRWRRLDDGTKSSATLKTGINDNQNASHSMSFPSQGYYVVEAQLGNENGSFPDTGGTTQGWWRLGNAVVNDSSSSLSGSFAFPGAEPSSPPSVNEGTAVNAVATVADSGGSVQIIEWDATNNGSFERREYTVPQVSGGNIVHPNLSTADRTQSVSTSSPGLRTVRARIFDNGALDAADHIRRSETFTGQLRVNAIPTAANVTKTVAEDSGTTTIALAGSDSDHQPAPLHYHLVSGPNAALGTLGPITGNTVEFTPAPNANGTTSFTYRVRDGDGSTVGANAFSNTATVTITVTPVNDGPIVDPKTISTDEDTPVDVQLTGSDVEDGASLDWSVDTGPTNGTATCTAAGLCTYTPNADFNGADSFVVRGSDSGSPAKSATATVSVTVQPVNDAPTAMPQSVTVAEDAVDFPITLSGSDIDTPSIGFVAPVDDVDHGTLTCFGGDCTYTPDADYNGPDSFTFRTTDGALESATATITITVAAVNDAPVATDVDVTTDEDVPVAVPAEGTDVDAGDVVTVSAAAGATHGTPTVTGPNEVTYDPNLDFHGVDSFLFTMVDGNGGADDGVATVTVTPVNDAPVVEDQSVSVDEDSPALFGVAAGDVDGDTLGWTVLVGPTSGQLFGSGPDFAYAPDLHFHGTDTFTVEVADGNGGADTAVITISVAPVNDQPSAQALAVSTDEDVDVDLTLVGSDIDGDTLDFTAPADLDATNGSIVCSGTACTYTPDADFHGADQFTYSVSDGQGGSDTASVSITVASVNDAPVTDDLSVQTDEDQPVLVTLVATDIDGDALTFSYSAANAGTVSGDGGDAVYVPNPNTFGTDTFGVTVTDGQGGSDSALVTVDVTPVNDAPVATGGTAVTDEDTDVSFQLGGTDVEGDALEFTVVEEPDGGQLDCDPTGACTFDPDEDFSGSAVLTYEVSDGEAVGTGGYTVVVDPVNDPPVPNPVAVTTAEDTPVAFALSATDVDADDLAYAVVAGPAAGSLVCSADGSCTYTPAPNDHGDTTFTWSVSDGVTEVAATATVSVVPVNDAPQALDVAAETDEDVPVDITLLANDPEGDPVAFQVVTPPAHGTVTVAGDVATYTPAADYSGTDQLTYRATDSHGASTTATVTLAVDEVPLLETVLTAEPAVVEVLLNPASLAGALSVSVFPSVSATLTTADGTPVAGRTITFSAAGNVICSAVTGPDGVGSCSQSAGLLSILTLGYQATFAGDADHEATTGRGPLLQLLTLRL